MSETRTGRAKLETLAREISDRDKEILASVRKYRYLTTGQIRRLHFRSAATDIAALRAANRILVKLKELKLLTPLARRIGGVRSGSASFVWTLSPVGARLLPLMARSEDRPVRKRFREPSPTFLEHTLAVAEVSIRLLELTFDDSSANLVSQELEPYCWRNYVGAGGAAKTLKPDLTVVTSIGEYEDHWFFEVDLATESPSQVVRKCDQYAAYQRNGAEQRKNGVFPFVVWLVPDEKRKDSLRRNIIRELRGDSGIFTVITMDEMKALITEGAVPFVCAGKEAAK